MGKTKSLRGADSREYQELELLHSTPLLWEANWMVSDETDILVETVGWMRRNWPDPDKVDMTNIYVKLMRASRIKYGTIVPALDAISAYLSPTYDAGEEIDFGSNGALALLEVAMALEVMKTNGGFIGLDPDPDGRNCGEEEPDDVLMGIA